MYITHIIIFADITEETILRSGSLYTWGLGKAGQLGIDNLPSAGSAAGMTAKPTIVTFFEKPDAPRPVQVSWYSNRENKTFLMFF